MLPFWKSIWPDLKVIVCVRNPLDVASSLLVRDQFPIGKSLRLWLEYYQALLDAAPPNRQIVTHYDSYFLDAKAEMQRMLAAVGLKPEAETIAIARSEIVAGVWKNRFGLADLETVGAPAKVIEMYERLCTEAGPVLAANRRTTEQRPAALMSLIGVTIHMENRIAERDNRIEELTDQIDALCDRLSARRYRYADRIANLARKMIASFRALPHKRNNFATGAS